MNAILLDEKIQVSFDYDPELVMHIKSIGGKEYDPATKLWTVPATVWSAKAVVDMFAGAGFIDPAVLQMAKGEAKAIKLPKELYKFQKEGVKFISSVGGRCLIADEMGLGKSAQALVFCSFFSRGRIVIVAPASVVFKWAELECPKWTPNKTVAVLTSGKDAIPDTDILIMSYSIMTSKYEELMDVGIDTVILDESHYIKSPKAKRTRIAKSIISGRVPRVLLLSGTPFMNNPGELFVQLNLIDPKSFDNWFKYAIRYCGAQKVNGMWFFPPNTLTNGAELEQRLKPYVLRRTKREVGLELPELQRTYVPVEVTLSGYKSAVKEFSEWKKKAGKKDNILTQLTKLRQLIGDMKVVPTIELATDVLETEQKIVVFAHHRSVVSGLADGLKSFGISIIDGGVAQADRQKLVDEFQKGDLRKRVMIITVAGAEGINLYAASAIIFAEREWVPAKEEQAEARLHRIGQRRNVMAYYLVAKDTIDENINEAVRKKRDMFQQVISQDDIVTTILENI